MTEPSIFQWLQRLFSGDAPADQAPRIDNPALPLPGMARPDMPRTVEFDFDDPRVPDTARHRVAVVQKLIADLEERAATEAVFSPVLIELHQMGEVHLPTLLQSYVDIPAAHRSEIFRKTGRSASFALNDGLDKMADRLRAMSASLAQGNLDAFTANMRFIESRYGAGYAPFD